MPEQLSGKLEQLIEIIVMFLSDENTVRKAEINFRLNSLTGHSPSGDDFVAWAKANIFEAIDFHAENLTDPDTLVEIAELEFILDIDDYEKFQTNSGTLKAVIWDKVYSSLKKAVQEHAPSGISPAKFRFNVVKEYVITGQLATDYTNGEWESLVSNFFRTLAESGAVYRELLEIVQNRHSFSRFYSLTEGKGTDQFFDIGVQQAGASKILKVLPVFLADNQKYFIQPNQEEIFYRAVILLKNGKTSLRHILQKLIRDALVPNRVATKTLRFSVDGTQEIWKAFSKSIQKEDGSPTHEMKAKTDDNITDTLREGSYVGQAGLVLLAPFIPMFLKKRGHIGGKGQLLKRHKIPILLHYLATGEKRAHEWKLSLPKLLAGIQLGEHCRTKIRPSKKLVEQITELLTAVIKHWGALKNTSPEGLRETFLIRDGVLRSKNGFYYLHIDEETVDILLNYVSWNYSTIRLNWMQQIVFVEWNKS